MLFHAIFILTAQISHVMLSSEQNENLITND